jgi:hypothetical protein
VIVDLREAIVMSPIKAELLKTLETAPEDAIEQTLTYLKTLLPKSSTDFQPKTPLGHKLWELRQRAIAEGMTLLSETELEQELADRRGGYRD